MAKTKKMLQGRVDNTVFYRVGDVTRVRSTASDYRDPRTVKQLQCRSRLRVATRFYQHLIATSLQRVWRVMTRGMSSSGFNLFMKLNVHVFGVDGRILDFSRLQLTVGILQGVNHLFKTVDEDDRVTLTWENSAGESSARGDDRLMVVVLYGNRSFSPVFVQGLEATRKDGGATFRLERKQGTAAHLYCFFGEKEGRAYSGSQYLRT